MLSILNIIHPSVDAWPQSGWETAIVVGLCSTARRGDAPAHARALLEGPSLSHSDASVRMCSVWHGLHGVLGALSLGGGRKVYLWHYGRNLSQILRDYQR